MPAGGVNYVNWYDKNQKSTSETWNNTFRVTAPIGVTYTPFPFKKGGALSLFASILDVGAMVDYQLNRSPTDSTVRQKIYLSDIFSPRSRQDTKIKLNASNL